MFFIKIHTDGLSPISYWTSGESGDGRLSPQDLSDSSHFKVNDFFAIVFLFVVE